MFCRLHEFYIDTGIKATDIEICTDKCADNMGQNCCAIVHDVQISLYKKEKFNWNITRIIDTEWEIIEDEETLTNAIKIMHPVHDSIWILRWASKNKSGNITDFYSVYMQNGKEIKIEDLEKVNWFLKKNCKYGGKPITIDDLKIIR